MADRIIRPIGPSADVRIYSDACTANGSLAAAAFFGNNEGERPVLAKGAAGAALRRTLLQTMGFMDYKRSRREQP